MVLRSYLARRLRGSLRNAHIPTEALVPATAARMQIRLSSSRTRQL